MSRRAKFVLLTFGIATAFGLLEFSYKHLDHVTRGDFIPPLVPLLEELTGSYSGVLTVLAAIWITRHYLRNVPIHLLAVVLVSIAHTSLMWGSRIVLFPVLGLGA